MNKIEELKKEIERKQKEILSLEEELKSIHQIEGVAILTPRTTLKDLQNLKDYIKNNFENTQPIEEMGLKKLAYEIKENNEGYYIRYFINATEKDIENIESFLRRADYVIKFLNIRADE